MHFEQRRVHYRARHGHSRRKHAAFPRLEFRQDRFTSNALGLSAREYTYSRESPFAFVPLVRVVRRISRKRRRQVHGRHERARARRLYRDAEEQSNAACSGDPSREKVNGVDEKRAPKILRNLKRKKEKGKENIATAATTVLNTV